MDKAKPHDNQHIITIVVVTLAINATVGVATLSACLFYNKEVNVALLTAFIGLVNFALGAIAGVLAKTYATTSTDPKPEVQSVVVTNKPSDPVPTDPV